VILVQRAVGLGQNQIYQKIFGRNNPMAQAIQRRLSETESMSDVRRTLAARGKAPPPIKTPAIVGFRHRIFGWKAQPLTGLQSFQVAPSFGERLRGETNGSLPYPTWKSGTRYSTTVCLWSCCTASVGAAATRHGESVPFSWKVQIIRRSSRCGRWSSGPPLLNGPLAPRLAGRHDLRVEPLESLELLNPLLQGEAADLRDLHGPIEPILRLTTHERDSSRPARTVFARRLPARKRVANPPPGMRSGCGTGRSHCSRRTAAARRRGAML
jgi:hypothetical protein